MAIAHRTRPATTIAAPGRSAEPLRTWALGRTTWVAERPTADSRRSLPYSIAGKAAARRRSVRLIVGSQERLHLFFGGAGLTLELSRELPLEEFRVGGRLAFQRLRDADLVATPEPLERLVVEGDRAHEPASIEPASAKTRLTAATSRWRISSPSTSTRRTMSAGSGAMTVPWSRVMPPIESELDGAFGRP